jgi:hypothetical protein
VKTFGDRKHGVGNERSDHCGFDPSEVDFQNVSHSVHIQICVPAYVAAGAEALRLDDFDAKRIRGKKKY